MPESTQILVKLTPKASKNAILGLEKNLLAESVLKVNITAVPEKGKANKALIELLAKHLGIPKSHISIIRGAKNRLKTIEIQGITTEQLNFL